MQGEKKKKNHTEYLRMGMIYLWQQEIVQQQLVKPKKEKAKKVSKAALEHVQ